jgi:hypothetical protein
MKIFSHCGKIKPRRKEDPTKKTRRKKTRRKKKTNVEPRAPSPGE